jgi:hypothetical protein
MNRFWNIIGEVYAIAALPVFFLWLMWVTI